ncbi:MAG TPA: enoyl-CoA hydratase/isomerase family protein [Anaerolineales bacterium]|nr:enoyl-CoA hydratase/isomerase family protein [Anaerolineales bacterium]HRQ92945.1 enoyl-CoA hydratase/isomerase family protein [Anaerolineales bacterium]
MTGIELTFNDYAVATLTVNRPHVRNGLDWAAMDAFAAAIKRAAANKNLRALIITGAGATFVSGGDLRALEPYTKRKDGMRLATVMGKALSQLRDLHCPTIAAINGPARGGGAEIAVACDQRIMAEDADIGFVHARLGITTAWGGARYLLQAVGYPTAVELLTTARILKAQEAKAIGLVGHLCAPGQALSKARELATEMSQHPVEAVHAAKRLLRFAVASPLVARHAERRLFSFLWDSEYRRQAVARFLYRN